MSRELDWARDGQDWPNRAASRFVQAGDLRWHVQIMGSGPVLLLLHGTGASTHSWRGMLPLLAPHFTLVAPDLPGHGFTSSPPAHRQSLAGMGRAVRSLLTALEMVPQAAVGHSAGAAILARMSLDHYLAIRALVSLNGAFMAPRGAAAQYFSPVARLLAQAPFVPDLFAWRASDRSVVGKLLDGTGSKLDAAGVELYARLASTPRHAGAALAMMANWDLAPLEQALPRLHPKLTLVAGSNDRTIPPKQAELIHRVVSGSVVVTMPGLGHLSHEEDPEQATGIVLRAIAAK